LSSTKAPTSTKELRLRVFAGPNGSGKSTVIENIRNYRVKKQPLDFGYYINADDIVKLLKNGGIGFSAYDISVTPGEFAKISIASGLINNNFTEEQFRNSFSLRKNILRLKNQEMADQMGQIISDYLRKKLLAEMRKFSFETVFSHASKLDIMQQAVELGYKVYLYFVSTEDPEINKFRVAARKMKGGHDVPPEKIESRYYRSLNLLYDASQICYQAFFFDNSVEGVDSKMFAHFKKVKGKKHWDKINNDDVPNWFLQYYSEKVKLKKSKKK
jgi:predicted ABC-type ATPase